MIRFLTYLTLALFITPFSAHSSETDAFTLRYVNFEDGIPALNTEVNKRIKKSIAIANASKESPCSLKSLEKAALSELRRTVYGKLEQFSNFSGSVPNMRTPISESVYKYVPFYKNFPLHFGKLSFGNVVRSGQHLIGVDKFGHFFNQGFDYYLEMRKHPKPLMDVMTLGTDSEEGFLGLLMTGVKSYADMTANFNGYLFWSNFLGSLDGSKTKPYVACSAKKKWVQIRTFDFAEYVDGGWDEGINCNEYRSESYAKTVFKAVQELEDKTGKRYQCPVFPTECVQLKKKYSFYSMKLLHPDCYSVQ